jgi:WD40 repeat protein/tRNA A-37 threonylcarbamoyl transferase component Bud32
MEPADDPGSGSLAESLYLAWAAAGEESAAFERLCREHPSLAGALREIRAGEALLRRVGPAAPDEGAQPAPRSSAARPEPARAPRYRRLGELGHGAMGRVLRVRDERLGRELALKVALASDGREARADELDPVRLRRFHAEARITGRLSHPNIVPLHDLDADAEGRPFFTMKLVQGKSLGEVFGLAREQRDGWGLARAVELLVRVCEALAHAHERGVVHRDLKPANVLVGTAGEVYVMDWGLARELEREDERDLRISEAAPGAGDSPLVTLDGHVLGTPVYMAPEQARGRLDQVGPQSDVYSLGAMLYELLTGRRPYVDPDGRTPARAALARVLAGPPRPVHALAPHAPAELESICERAMARELAQRYPSMDALGADLRAWIEGRVVGAHASGAWPELVKWAGRNRGFAAGIAMSVVLLLVALVLWRSRAGAVAFAAEQQRARAVESRSSYIAALDAARLALEAGDPRAARERLGSAPLELRHFEWHVLERPIELPGDLLLPPGVPARCVLTLGERGLVVGRGVRAELLDLDGGLAGHTVREVGAGIISLAASADVRQLGLGVQGRWPLLLDLEAEGAALELSSPDERPDATSSVALSPDGTRLASAHLGPNVRLWSVADARQIAAFDSGTPQVYAVAWSPDGATIAAGARMGVLLLDSGTGAVEQRLSGSLADYTLAWEPSGERIAAAGMDRIVRTWRASGELAAELHGHRDQVLCLAWSPAGTLLASGDEAGDLRLWSPDGRRVPRVVGNLGARAVGVAFIDAATLVAVGGDGAVRRIPLEASPGLARLVGRHTGGPFGVASAAALAFDPAGRMLASGGDDSLVHLWDVEHGTHVRTLAGHTNRIEALGWTPDGELLVSASVDGTLGLWSPESGERLATLVGHEREVTDLLLIDEHAALSCSLDGTLRRWDLEARAAAGAPLALGLPLRRLAHAPDRQRIAAGADDGTLVVLDARTLAEHGRLALGAPVTSLAFLDPVRLAAGTGKGSGTVEAVDVHALTAQRWRGPGRDAIAALAPSPDGRRLVVVDTAPSFHETEEGSELLRLPGLGARPAIAATFSGDGRLLALGTLGGEVLLLEASVPMR